MTDFYLVFYLILGFDGQPFVVSQIYLVLMQQYIAMEMIIIIISI